MEDEFCRRCSHPEVLHTGTLAFLRAGSKTLPGDPTFGSHYCVACKDDKMQGKILEPSYYADIHDWDPVVATEGGLISV